MAKNTAAALQHALSKSQAAKAKPAPTLANAPTYYVAPSRSGKVAINVYLEADYKRSLRLLQANSGRSLQAIIGEALNDIFAKHGVATVSEEVAARQEAPSPHAAPRAASPSNRKARR